MDMYVHGETDADRSSYDYLGSPIHAILSGDPVQPL